MKTMDRILLIMAIVLALYTIINLWIFYKTGSEPSTLTTCIFGACTGEAGVMSWIKTTKIRREDRKWEKEDRDENQ